MTASLYDPVALQVASSFPKSGAETTSEVCDDAEAAAMEDRVGRARERGSARQSSAAKGRATITRQSIAEDGSVDRRRLARQVYSVLAGLRRERGRPTVLTLNKGSLRRTSLNNKGDE